MKKSNKNKQTEQSSFIDRFYFGIFNALISIPTAIVTWAVLNGFPISANYWLHSQYILWVIGLFFLAGIVANDIIFCDLYKKLWKILLTFFGVAVK